MGSLTTEKQAVLPTATEPLPTPSNPRGYALLRSLEAAEAAMSDPNDRAAIKAATDELRCALQPAERREIAGHVEALACFHPRSTRSDREAGMYVQGWLADLAHLPADIIDAACVEWRRNACPFMPKPGELLTIAEPILRHRKRLYERGERLLNAPRKPSAAARPVEPSRDPAIAEGLAELARSVGRERDMAK